MILVLGLACPIQGIATPSCDNKEIAQAYSSISESPRYLRFFRNKSDDGYVLNVRDCANSTADGFLAFTNVSRTMLNDALTQIHDSKYQSKAGYSLMVFSDLGILEVLFSFLVESLVPTDCHQETLEVFPIEMYAFQIDNEFGKLLPGAALKLEL